MTKSEKPVPAKETPTPLDSDLLQDVENALQQKHGQALAAGHSLELQGKKGDRAAWLRIWIGTQEEGNEFEFFVRGVAGEAPQGALSLVLDFADDVLTEFFNEDQDAYLPLDFTGHEYDGHFVYARQETRHLKAESMADDFLAKHGFDDDEI